MKRLFAVILAAVLLLSLTTATLGADAKVQRSSQRLTVDGEAVECPAYNIDGYNYVKLRTLAALLADSVCPFDVAYDKASNSVVITRGAAYSGPAEEDDGVDHSADAKPSAQTVIVNDAAQEGLSVWNIAGSNWFRLSELAGLIGFELSYDSATRTAQLVTLPLSWNAGDYAEVYDALNRTRGGVNTGTKAGGDLVAVEEAEAPAPAQTATAAETAAADNAKGTRAEPATDAEESYSGTNTQVEGIDEGDIVKTDGKYLYVLRDQELTILKADGADTAVISRTQVGLSYYEDNIDIVDGEKVSRYVSKSKYPSEMFVYDGRLCVISHYYSYRSGMEDGVWRYENKEYSCVDVYDVSDPAAPKALAALGQDGYILGSRMIGGKVYLVTNYWVWNWKEEEPSTYVPALYKDGEMRILPAECICIDPQGSSTEYVVLCEYDLSGAECSASQSLLGGGDTLYMNDSGIYVMGSRWTEKVRETYTESVYTVEYRVNASETEICRFDPTDGLKLSASGRIPGYLESQFSADEYGGYLRLVTTSNDNAYRIFTDDEYNFTNYRWEERQQTTGLYVLDGDLKLVGKVDDLAPGERVYSARFDGDIAYFCTFRNVDPLFAVDISDPTAPKVLSALKISGFSEYLHPWSEGRLFGFGREADEETGWSEQLKLVMFNTEDKTDVSAKHTAIVEDCWYSEALYDHKAFFIDGNKNIIGFVGDSDYYIYSYDDAEGFRLMCTFDYDTWPGSVRGFWIGENAYIVGQHVLQVLSLDGWERVLTLKLDTEDWVDEPVVPYKVYAE